MVGIVGMVESAKIVESVGTVRGKTLGNDKKV